MLFNTLDFAVFMPVVFALYWLIGGRNVKAQNALIVVASYVFYGWWDWRFLTLIFFSSVLDFSIGRVMDSQTHKNRKALLWISILANLGLLGFFKYYNFFVDNFIAAFSLFGTEIESSTLNIILPVGISFYTFQTLSYTIDVYRKKIEPGRDFVAFLAFVGFFPQLVAGPIERASNLLPQFVKQRQFSFEKARDGLRQILWGLFKKMVIADNCAEYANELFNYHDDFTGFPLMMGAVLFAFQIYGDFSGYSDIAIGTSRLLGFDLMKNFSFPYFSRDIAEFWRRWHISLSTWFRDYLYIPLGGSRGGRAITIRNTFIIFLVSGFWHGANWTFIVWGGIHAMLFLPLLLARRNRKNLDVVAENRALPSLREAGSMLITFITTCVAWIFFRAESLSHAVEYISNMLKGRFFKESEYLDYAELGSVWALVLLFLIIEWLGRQKEYGFQIVERLPGVMAYLASCVLIILIVMFMSLSIKEFVYFQF